MARDHQYSRPGRAILDMGPLVTLLAAGLAGSTLENPRLPEWPIACMLCMQTCVSAWRVPSWAFRVGYQLSIALRPVRGRRQDNIIERPLDISDSGDATHMNVN